MPYSSNKVINDLEAKTTPIDADSTVIGDSADTNRAKKTTWANIKATLKAYFDTIYTNGVGVANRLAYWVDTDTVGNLDTATYPSLTEISYVKGATSALQTQITAKAAKGANTDITSLGGLTTALSVAQGGTGATTLDDHYVLIGSGTSAITPITPDTAGKVLMSNGVSADPTFQTLTTPLILLTASDNLKYSANTERTEVSNINYVIKKEIIIRQKGTIRVKFDLKGSDTTYSFRGRIYVNGIAVGTERNQQGAGATTYATYSEDITINAYDLVQLYIKNEATGGLTTYCRNFRIYYDITNPENGTVNTD